MSQAAEEWRPIRDWQGYEASSLGRVRSWRPRCRNATAPAEPRILKASPTASGHLRVTLCNGKRRKQMAVHVAVATEWKGPRPVGAVVRHFPERSPADNRPDNLHWGTHVDNSADAAVHGTRARGERNGSAKLTDAEVAQIHAQKGFLTSASLAAAFGISRRHVKNIWQGLYRSEGFRWGRRKGVNKAPRQRPRGKRNAAAKLSDVDAYRIWLHRRWIKRDVLADVYGVHPCTVAAIHRGRYWAETIRSVHDRGDWRTP